MTLPKTEDVRKVRDQAVSAVSGVLEQVRTPLLAAFGAGDLAAQAVRDVVTKAREEVSERAGATHKGDKIGPSELRKVVDSYKNAALKQYHRLAEHGEDAFDKLRRQPRVKRAIEQIEGAAETAQERVEEVATDARELADEMLAKVTRRTRSAGEKTARAVQKVAGEAAEQVSELGDEAAHGVRSTTRKTATRTSPRKTTSTRSPRGSK